MFCSLAGLAAVATVVACSSSDDGRESFDDTPDSGFASLPEAAADPEASTGDASPIPKPPFDPADEAVVCASATAPCAVQLVAGEHHFCARMSDGTARCWGDGTSGTLGYVDAGPGDGGKDGGDASKDGGDAGAAAFVVGTVTGLSGATQLGAGGSTTCALVGDGGVRCWGANDHAQLGLKVSPVVSDDAAHPTPAAVALPSGATRVDVGQRGACAVLATKETWCWGDNTQRQLARSSTVELGGPGKAELGALTLVRTASGTNSAFGVTSTGDVVSWGAVAGPEGSVAARVASVSPDALPLSLELAPATSFSVSSTLMYRPPGGGFPRPPLKGIAHACAVVKGSLYCWGDSLMGALGTGLPEPALAPTLAVVKSEKAWAQQVAAAGDITCVRLTDGSVQCAGDNTRGALGTDPEKPYSMFFAPATGFKGHAVQVAAAAATVCALVQGGTVQCWGSNELGELGRGTTDEEPHATAQPIGF